MTEAETLTLHYLRRIDEKVDRLAGDMREVKLRLGNIEHQLALHERQIAHGLGLWAEVSARVDRMGIRLERIEHRLGIAGPI